jgi:hypothetical protein
MLSFSSLFPWLALCPIRLVPSRGSKTLQSIGRHFADKWKGAGSDPPQLRFHALSTSPEDHFAGTSWGPVIGKGVTVGLRGEPHSPHFLIGLHPFHSPRPFTILRIIANLVFSRCY